MEQPDSEWWRSWFGRGYLALYDEYLAERTPVEIDQLEALLTLRPPQRILDLPCGQGRHAIELARRGYDVTGADLSPYLLEVAEERRRARSVRVRWLSADMRRPIAGETFDVVLNLFTSLGYFADETDDRKVVRAASAMLASGGRFVLELINLLLLSGHQAGLKGCKPVIAQPAKGHRAQRAARQLGQRVMRHRLAAVEEERDFVA